MYRLTRTQRIARSLRRMIPGAVFIISGTALFYMPLLANL